MNVEEMVARIRELSTVRPTALLPVISNGEHLVSIEVDGGRLVLTFTDPYAEYKFSDFEDKGIDF